MKCRQLNAREKYRARLLIQKKYSDMSPIAHHKECSNDSPSTFIDENLSSLKQNIAVFNVPKSKQVKLSEISKDVDHSPKIDFRQFSNQMSMGNHLSVISIKGAFVSSKSLSKYLKLRAQWQIRFIRATLKTFLSEACNQTV